MRMLPEALDILSSRGIAPSGCFVDVGANIGTATFTALTACGFATAVAIEPEDTNAALVMATAALNGLGNCVRVVRAAALDHENGARLLRHRVSSARHMVDADGDVHVPSVTLDGLGLERVGMLWIDAEGSEGQVLDGARDLVRARPPIVLEFNPLALRHHRGLESVMRVALGYAERLNPSSGEPLDLERLADELDGHGGRKTRRVDVLLVP
jgi:FkbM family methyltransferase